MNHKVSLRVGAHGAHLGGFFADVNMTAVGAFPHYDTRFFKYFIGFHIVQEFPVFLLLHFLLKILRLKPLLLFRLLTRLIHLLKFL